MPEENHRWGDYYLSGGRKRKSWLLEMIHLINQSIPTFNELFDEETFYLFAFLVVIGSILVAVFLSKVVGIKLREHPLRVDREWRNPMPAHFFDFPFDRRFKYL
ncbi:unnamed protein product [Enterobius vermicularis]|uniref:Uncharacterized protein n=1 Tax=Enterobius vermicularis TaxID=51028 RepID=A0A0N4VHH9_ENTVE|nr:unnamed protein product [Enterobius vermicularis]